jgi:hypothetical protein
MNKTLSIEIKVKQKTARINDPPTPVKIDFTAAIVIFFFFLAKLMFFINVPENYIAISVPFLKFSRAGNEFIG